MINSMTGFARTQGRHGDFRLVWELRSVNHRFLDLQFRLPDVFRGQEQNFRGLLSERLHRGKVDASLFIQTSASGSGRLELDRGLLDALLEHAGQLAKDVDQPPVASSVELLRWPGVLAEADLPVETLAEPATELLGQALDQLVQARATEGERIAGMLRRRCEEISALTAAIRQRLPQVLARLEEKLRARLAELSIDTDPGRLEQELVLQAQKLDVEEELDRLQSHVDELEAITGREGAQGRRLDFLIQELNREANTLASKSGDTDTTRMAVDLKVLIEQMREQAQNVE